MGNVESGLLPPVHENSDNKQDLSYRCEWNGTNNATEHGKHPWQESERFEHEIPGTTEEMSPRSERQADTC